MDINDIRFNLRKMICDYIDEKDVVPDDITDEIQLFGDGVGLDSIDALELWFLVKRNFKIDMPSDIDDNRKIMYNIITLSNYIKDKYETVPDTRI